MCDIYFECTKVSGTKREMQTKNPRVKPFLLLTSEMFNNIIKYVRGWDESFSQTIKTYILIKKYWKSSIVKKCTRFLYIGSNNIIKNSRSLTHWRRQKNNWNWNIAKWAVASEKPKNAKKTMCHDSLETCHKVDSSQ